MTGPSTAALDLAGDAVASAATQVSLHTADPGTAGGSEVAGGAYARKTVTYDTSTGDGTADLSASVTFDVPASTTVTHWGAWAGTTWLGGEPLDANKTFSNAGTYELTSAPIAAG